LTAESKQKSEAVNDMKAVRVRSPEDRTFCIKMLKKHGSCNLYLFEGISEPNSRSESVRIIDGRETVGIVHTRNGSYVHLFLRNGLSTDLYSRICRYVFRRFSHASVLFGDRESIEKLPSVPGVAFERMRDFLFMEVRRGRFTPVPCEKAVEPTGEKADQLASLQIGYEIEELGVRSTEISRKRTEAVVRRRIERGEVTAVYEGETPVAFASVNARFECTCQIGSVYVVPAYRGKGYGKAIVSAHLARLFDRYGRVVLFVKKTNTRAIHVYTALGFLVQGELVQVSVSRT
jgi:GNAT superfamily N-acetyltransferase